MSQYKNIQEVYISALILIHWTEHIDCWAEVHKACRIEPPFLKKNSKNLSSQFLNMSPRYLDGELAYRMEWDKLEKIQTKKMCPRIYISIPNTRNINIFFIRYLICSSLSGNLTLIIILTRQRAEKRTLKIKSCLSMLNSYYRYWRSLLHTRSIPSSKMEFASRHKINNFNKYAWILQQFDPPSPS